MQSAAFDMLIEPDPRLTQRWRSRWRDQGAVIQIAAQGVDRLGTVPTDTNTVQL